MDDLGISIGGSGFEEKMAIHQQKRKDKRLDILKEVLTWIFLAFIGSIAVCIGLKLLEKEVGTELLALNIILGSALTTIIGVIAGTSID